MQSSQLRHIQNIENSLSLLKFKIEKMSQLDLQKQQTLDKLILSTIPVVDKKLKQQKQHRQYQAKKSTYGDRHSLLRKRNKESKMEIQKEVNRSKELVTTMKLHNSMHLKQSKKTNQAKIKKIKELNLHQKKNQTQKIKEQEKETQIRIQQFHQQKNQDLKKRRNKENLQNQSKIDHLMKELKILAKKEKQMEQKLNVSEENVCKFRSVIKKVDKMKLEEFTKLKEKVLSPDCKKINSRSLSQAILLYTTSEGLQQQ